jgi:hypothetical protein
MDPKNQTKTFGNISVNIVVGGTGWDRTNDPASAGL